MNTKALSEVWVRAEGNLLRVTLNRPKALNALNHDMIRDFSRALQDEVTQHSTFAALWLDGAGERGFCGGGDVKQLLSQVSDDQLAFLGDEYRLDLALAASPIPVISVMHGVAMGGGIGVGGHAANRIVTETSRLGMPEVRIGAAPDVGGALLLAKAPGRLGELLTITAGSMTAGDALALGFADYFVHEADIADLRQALSDGAPFSEAISQVAQPAPPSTLLSYREWWEPLVEAALGSAESVLQAPASAARRLLAALEELPLAEAQEVATQAQQMSPTALAVALAQLARVRLLQQSLGEVLADDYRVFGRLLQRSDFAEGVRAQLIDRDGEPRWSPDHLDAVSDEEVLRICDPTLLPGETAWQARLQV